jgi:hypothetical protein
MRYKLCEAQNVDATYVDVKLTQLGELIMHREAGRQSLRLPTEV